MTTATLEQAVERGGSLLFRLVRSLAAAECSDTRCCGVTVGQCLALLAMGPGCCPEGDGRDGATMRRVASALGVSPGTATRVIDNLVRDGLVERCDNPSDRRSVCVRPTAEGTRVIEALEDCYSRLWTAVFQRVPRERLDDTLAALELLADAVGEAAAECCSPATSSQSQ